MKLLNNIIIFSANHQYNQQLTPVVYFHFETVQCWMNHGAQFVMEELAFAKVCHICLFLSEIETSLSWNHIVVKGVKAVVDSGFPKRGGR